MGNLRLNPGWNNVSFTANTGPAKLLAGSSLDIEIKAPAEVIEGGEQRGILVDTVRVAEVSSSGIASRSPSDEVGLLLGVLLLYLIVARASGTSPPVHVRRLALICAAAALAVVAWALAAYRVDMVVALPYLLFTLIAGYLLLAITWHLFPAWPRPLYALFAAAFMLSFRLLGPAAVDCD